jgi:hypothetical protein
MKKGLISFMVCLLIFVVGYSQNSHSIYVSASGKDNNPGTIAKPFATLEKARKEVRKILAKEKNISITVYFRAGIIFKNSVVFDSLDSGTEDHPVTYSAYNNETVSFSGGIPYQLKMQHP